MRFAPTDVVWARRCGSIIEASYGHCMREGANTKLEGATHGRGPKERLNVDEREIRLTSKLIDRST